MDSTALAFFPFPHVLAGLRREGVVWRWPERCSGCDRQCETSTQPGLSLCGYGVNYVRLSADLLVAGIVVVDYPNCTPARQKMLRLDRHGPSIATVRYVESAFKAASTADHSELQLKKQELIDQYKKSEGYREDVLLGLRPQLKRMLSQIHDYRQFVSTVVQNMNVILERRDSREVPIEEKLSSASHEEVAIYWAARLLEERLQTALFLVEPKRLDNRSDDSHFKVHGCILKYVKIYQRSFDQKGISIDVRGESHGEMKWNRVAFGVIPQTLLDNALKYSPQNAKVEVGFVESNSSVELTVGSYGPRIVPGERIFDLFVRGKEAERAEPDGTGYGLHMAQLVASKFGSTIDFTQDTGQSKGGRFWTEFKVAFPLSPRAQKALRP